MNRDDAVHLLRRTGFAVRESDVTQLMALDRVAGVSLVTDFAPNSPAQPPPEIADPEGSRWRQIRDLRDWWIQRMMTVPRPLQEKMTLFWHSHFAASAERVYFATQTWEQNHLFRLQGLGNYRDLVHATSIDPAMVLYLDGYRNKAGNPNENYARELMELHTLGPGNYTENDIVELAKAWTGHMLDESYRNYEFKSYHHDYRNKTIFGITRDWNGPEVIDEILLGSKQVAASEFITKKMFEYFVYEGPSASLVSSLATSFRANGLNIGLLLRDILLHSEFWSTRARQAIVRSPVEYMIQCIVGAGSTFDEARPDWWLRDMGHDLFYPPNPSGWQLNGFWLSASSTWAKAEFARHLAWKAVRRDHLQEIETEGVPMAVALALHLFGISDVSPTTRTALENYLYAERATWEWPQHANLLTLTMLTPEIQVA